MTDTLHAQRCDTCQDINCYLCPLLPKPSDGAIELQLELVRRYISRRGCASHTNTKIIPVPCDACTFNDVCEMEASESCKREAVEQIRLDAITTVLNDLEVRVNSESESADVPCQDGWHTGMHSADVIRISYLEKIIESLRDTIRMGDQK